MNTKGIAVVVLCIVLVATAGCMGWDGSASQISPIPPAPYSGDSSEPIQEMKVSYSSYSVDIPAPSSAQSEEGSLSGGIETKIIKSATLTIEVKDVPGSIESLKSLAVAKGGYLSSTNIRKNYYNQVTGTAVLRIPQAEFENTLAGVKAIGTVKSASTQGEDVTEEYVDLQAQKVSYQNQLAQYNTIMKQTTSVEDIIKVQEQIDRVQTKLDRLEGRLKFLDSRIDFSTITVNLEEPEPVGGESGHSFVSVINEGISGFFGMIDVIIILFFTFLPLFILGGIGYGIHRWYKGRKETPVIEENTEKK